MNGWSDTARLSSGKSRIGSAAGSAAMSASCGHAAVLRLAARGAPRRVATVPRQNAELVLLSGRAAVLLLESRKTADCRDTVVGNTILRITAPPDVAGWCPQLPLVRAQRSAVGNRAPGRAVEGEAAGHGDSRAKPGWSLLGRLGREPPGLKPHFGKTDPTVRGGPLGQSARRLAEEPPYWFVTPIQITPSYRSGLVAGVKGEGSRCSLDNHDRVGQPGSSGITGVSGITPWRGNDGAHPHLH